MGNFLNSGTHWRYTFYFKPHSLGSLQIASWENWPKCQWVRILTKCALLDPVVPGQGRKVPFCSVFFQSWLMNLVLEYSLVGINLFLRTAAAFLLILFCVPRTWIGFLPDHAMQAVNSCVYISQIICLGLQNLYNKSLATETVKRTETRTPQPLAQAAPGSG